MTKKSNDSKKTYVVKAGSTEIAQSNGAERAIVIAHHYKGDSKKQFIENDWECRIPDPKEEGKTKVCTAFTTLGKHLKNLPIGEKLTMKGLGGQGNMTISVIEREEKVVEINDKKKEKQDAKAKSDSSKNTKTKVSATV